MINEAVACVNCHMMRKQNRHSNAQTSSTPDLEAAIFGELYIDGIDRISLHQISLVADIEYRPIQWPETTYIWVNNYIAPSR